MKGFLTAGFLVLALTGCRHADTALRERLGVADSVAINFFRGDGSVDTVIAVTIIRDSAEIGRLAAMIAESETEKDVLHCGYDGSMHFFKMDKVFQDVKFRVNDPACRYFSFSIDGRQVVSELEPGAVDRLASLRKKAAGSSARDDR